MGRGDVLQIKLWVSCGECGGSPLEYGGGGGVGAWGDSVVPEHPALATGSAVETCAARGRDLAGVLEQRVRRDGIAST